MKRFILSIFILSACATSLLAQITREQADAIVLEYLQNEVSLPCKLYVNINMPSEAGIDITTYHEETVKVKYACWAYYLNEFPDASGVSQHRYLFVKEDNGNLLEIITSNDLGPNDLMEWISIYDADVTLAKTPSCKIYPNPTTGELTINNEQLTINIVEVFDVYGRKQISDIRYPTSEIGKSEIEINLANLPAGIYFLRISTETATQIQKIIKH